ncbi:STAS domain-containing protein [Nonomuraea sp. NPDC049709]|uniref:STAS domain-containing protein n=1 Tax=Nonomuraea sp. NPDC049709 TaxID=3154736 RepID=UPI00342A585F
MGASRQREPSTSPARVSTTPLNLAHGRLPGVCLIAVGGEIDIANSARLARHVGRVRRPGDHVVFDLTRLSFMDCSGLRVLLSSARRAADDDAGVHLAGARGAPARLLRIVRLDAHLPMYDTVAQAVTAVRRDGLTVDDRRILQRIHALTGEEHDLHASRQEPPRPDRGLPATATRRGRRAEGDVPIAVFEEHHWMPQARR